MTNIPTILPEACGSFVSDQATPLRCSNCGFTRSKHAPITTGKERAKATQFKPGQIANPAGRPKGSRNKLGEDFVKALQEDFSQHGVKAIADVREDRPHEYLKVVASLLPKQVEIKEGAFDGVSDEQLAALVYAARSALSVAEGGGEGTVN